MNKRMKLRNLMPLVGLATLMTQGCDELVKPRPSAETPEQAAETAYQMCGGCHGPRDIRVNLMPPYIWGQKEKYLITALTAYRDRTREHPIMNSLTYTFSDHDIANLAHYLAEQPWEPWLPWQP